MRVLRDTTALLEWYQHRQPNISVGLVTRAQVAMPSPCHALRGYIRMRLDMRIARRVLQDSTAQEPFQRRIPTARWCARWGITASLALLTLSHVPGGCLLGTKVCLTVRPALSDIHASSPGQWRRASAQRGSFAGPTTHRRSPVRWAPTATRRVYATRPSVCCAHLASTARQWGCRNRRGSVWRGTSARLVRRIRLGRWRR
jgi:hypothetical protein